VKKSEDGKRNREREEKIYFRAKVEEELSLLLAQLMAL
jgi:hypothetical protein